MYKAAQRLKAAQLECRDALWVIEHYDSLNAVFYIDPPYVLKSRARATNRYVARYVPFDELTADALNEWMKVREPEPTLFYSVRTRKPLSGEGVRTIIRRLAEKEGITERTNPHGWRHLFAELYHKAGGQIASLSKLLGHKSTVVTANIYLNFSLQTALEDYEEHNPMKKVAEELKKRGERED